MPDVAPATALELNLLTFAEAARQTGKPKVYLKELVETGQLSVRLLPHPDGAKQRLEEAELVRAGLLGGGQRATPEHSELEGLIELIREQTARIAVIEEHRFQLGAQFGAACERIRSLEQQAESLAAALEASLARPRGHSVLPVLVRIAFASGRRGLIGARILQSIAAGVVRSSAGAPPDPRGEPGRRLN